MIIGTILTALVALEHFYFLALEMFLWTQPRTRAIFGTSAEDAEKTKTLAANQGLYNGFLAVGLLVGIFMPNEMVGFAFKVYFLLCVIVAGLYGGATVSKRIIYVQAVPALLGLVAVWFLR